MTEARKYLIVLDAGNTVFFLGRLGEHTECAENVMIFEDESEARLYIDKHGIGHIASVHKAFSKNTEKGKYITRCVDIVPRVLYNIIEEIIMETSYMNVDLAILAQIGVSILFGESTR